MTESQVLSLRESGGFALDPEFGLIEISGADAATFLQFRTTNDVLALQPGQGQLSSILDRTAHLHGMFSLHRLEDSYWLVVEKNVATEIIEQMEQYHFAEKITILNRSEEGLFWTVQGPCSLNLLAEIDPASLEKLDSEYSTAHAKVAGQSLIVIRRTITGEDGFLFWVPAQDQQVVIRFLNDLANRLGLIPQSPDSLNVARIEAGLPRFGEDMSAEDLLPDTGLEEACVRYTKGCYLGQEVIARIKTYSAPRKGLVGLMFSPEDRQSFPLNTPIFLEGKEIGVVKSNAYSPTLNRTIAMSFLSRQYRVPDKELMLTINGSNYLAVVTLLPFYRTDSRKDRAHKLYEKALAEFAADDESQAIAHLREALQLDPLFADGYEALGVILSKQDQLSEAIDLMQQLAKIEPDSIMAHTNLSVFYMQQGNKEAAEEEKAAAMSISMQKIAQEIKSQQALEEEKERKRLEAVERIGMFKQVLEVDSEDQLANYGIGNLYVEIDAFAEALPHLTKAVVLKPDHTAAYLALGSAYAGLGQSQQAAEIYTRGIEVAAKRGDMTPLKEMQKRVQLLGAGRPSQGDVGSARQA